MSDLINFARITALALADSVNPCAIAVLAMVLVTILMRNPDRKRKILFGGLAFASSVFIGYMFYGLIIVQFFSSFAQFLRQYSYYIYDGLAIMSMIIGALNIKEFFFYKKGEFATEMPLSFRPKVKKVIEKITSVPGAFAIGFIVTLFLLPCTMGPYIIASGLLSELGILGAMPWLMYYNLVFVLPMLIIVFLIYFGAARVQDVSGWKDLNIKRLHLIAGILLFLTGLAILLDWL